VLGGGRLIVGISAPVPRLRPRTEAARRTAAAFLIVGLPVLAGCGANFNAQTNQPYQPAEGVSTRTGEVDALNTLVVTDGEGNGTIVSRLVNQQDVADGLALVTAVDSTGEAITAAPPLEPITLEAAVSEDQSVPSPDQSVQVGTDGALRLTGDNIVAGTFITLTLTFAVAAPITVEVPVVDAGPTYADIPVGPVTPTETTATG
jgi:hypothetical protein